MHAPSIKHVLTSVYPPLLTAFLVSHQNRSRNPDWSLGYYNHTIIQRANDDNDNPQAPIRRIFDYFIGGQFCDETNEGREVEVQMKCCSTRNARENSNSKNGRENSNLKSQSARENTKISSITEPETCSYKMTVCSDLLCDPAPDKKPSLVELMKELNSVCVHRQEDWWTYELCLSKGVRQYHAEAEKDDKGRTKAVVKVCTCVLYVMDCCNE